MTLDRSSWLVRFAFLADVKPGERHWSYKTHGWEQTPSHVTLCALFWRCVLRVWGLFLLGFFAYVVVVQLIVPHWRDIVFWLAIAICAAPACAVVFIAASSAEDLANRVKLIDGPIATAIWGIKNRVCPIIQITGPEPIAEDDAA